MTDRHDADSGIGDGGSGRPGRLTYEIDADEPPHEAVVRAVAAYTNTPVVELDPLYDVVDPHYLDGILAEPDEDDRIERAITLAFNGCEVTVRRETVRVSEPDDDTG